MWDSSQALDPPRLPISSEAIDECGPTPPGKEQRSGGAGSSSDRYDEVMLSPVAMPPAQAAGAAHAEQRFAAGERLGMVQSGGERGDEE